MAANMDVQAVDDLMKTIECGEETVCKIDHHRLAKDCSEDMPPSCLILLKFLPELGNSRVALDLPLRFLSYYEPSSESPSVAYCTKEFLQARHGLESDDPVLEKYQEKLNEILKDIPEEQRSPVTDDRVTLNYGITELVSKFDFETTEQKLTDAVTSQGDTIWFGEVDFSASCKLLLFGGPKPGAKAMKQYPKLGLIAFCQKVLIVKDENDGGVKVLFNDIEKINALHYNVAWWDLLSTLPHKVINYRLYQTFSKAVCAE